jgi:type IV pilus assembly protein PilC
VESGEQSGTLDVMLARIATYKERTESLKRKIKKAMYYPSAVLLIAGIVTVILLLKVVPTFKSMFASFNAALPSFTQMVLDLSDFIKEYGFQLLSLLILSVIGFLKSYQQFPSVVHFLDRLSLKLPIIGGILKKAATARFTRTLATTTAAGVPLSDALEAVAKAAGNIVYTNAIREIKDGLASGQQLRVTMKRTGVFQNMVVQMIGIGEESGSLEEMLSKVADIYEEEVNIAVDGLTTLIEPLIMVLLGVIVGSLVVAMYLPIFKMGSIL